MFASSFTLLLICFAFVIASALPADIDGLFLSHSMRGSPVVMRHRTVQLQYAPPSPPSSPFGTMFESSRLGGLSRRHPLDITPLPWED